MNAVYLERGQPVRLLCRWGGSHASVDSRGHRVPPAPRNVLIERADGSKIVRPFRGLRVPR